MRSKMKAPPVNAYNIAVSGLSAKAFSFIAQRFHAEWGYKPRESESWVLSSVRPRKDFTVSSRMATMGWLTGLWRAPAGALFVSEALDGQVYVFPDIEDRDRDFKTYEVEGTLSGIWGLDDTLVLTWGSIWEGKHLVHRWTGKGWTEFPSTPFSVRAMHGIAPDHILAVGTQGGVARFDGKRWRSFRAPTSEVLNSVFVAGPDEYYATGGQGILLQGNAAGWHKIGESPVLGKPLLGVAKWKGALFVAGGSLGLFRRIPKRKSMELYKTTALATGFDARGDLLVSCRNGVATSTDGVDFVGIKNEVLLEMWKGKRLGDLR